MTGRRWKSAVRIALSCWVVACACFFAGKARADEQLIVKHPGDHPVYTVEAEPHLTLAFLVPRAGSSGLGLGGRFTFPIVKNGFISSINNSVGIGVGLDYVHYDGCYRDWVDPRNCNNLDTFYIPVVMQWNFFLSTHWSVFGEPGIAITHNSYGSCVDFYTDDRGNTVSNNCGRAPGRVGLNPFVMFIGGRYHFSETMALTMRIGWPYMSVGLSFLP